MDEDRATGCRLLLPAILLVPVACRRATPPPAPPPTETPAAGARALRHGSARSGRSPPSRRQARRARRILRNESTAEEERGARVVLARRLLADGKFEAAMEEADRAAALASNDLERTEALEVWGRAALALGAHRSVLVRLAPAADVPALAGLRALAQERLGPPEAAVTAMLGWWHLAEDPASKALALLRARRAAARVPPARRVVPEDAPGPVGRCLAAVYGIPGLGGAADPRCTTAPYRVGVLLPLSGPLKDVGQAGLDGALAAAELLPGLALRIQDTGEAPPERIAEYAQGLAGELEAVVGPVDPMAVAQVARQRRRGGGGAAVVLPGAPVSGLPGVAPSLEARVEALLAHAGGGRGVVLAPEGPYGDRVLGVVRRVLAAGLEEGRVRVRRYARGVTSFRGVLADVSLLGPGDFLLVADRVGRTENLLRQLARRAGWEVPPHGRGGRWPAVLLTAEGLVPSSAGAVLQGARVAPAVWPVPEDRTFERAYRERTGAAPPPVARLVYRALRRASGYGPLPGETRPRVGRIAGRKLVGIRVPGS